MSRQSLSLPSAPESELSPCQVDECRKQHDAIQLVQTHLFIFYTYCASKVQATAKCHNKPCDIRFSANLFCNTSFIPACRVAVSRLQFRIVCSTLLAAQRTNKPAESIGVESYTPNPSIKCRSSARTSCRHPSNPQIQLRCQTWSNK